MQDYENPDRIVTYQKHFSEEKFYQKILRFAKKAGVKVVYVAFLLYYVFPSLPIKERSIVIGALGYLIMPLDLIPDFIPGVGFMDDLASMLLVLKLVYSAITPEIEIKAKQKIIELFDGNVTEDDFILFDEK